MRSYIHGRKKRLALAVGAWLLAGAFSVAPSAAAHPILDAAGAGVTISGTSAMNITSDNPNNLIKWVDFSIGKNESVNFNDTNNYLNYVTGSARSDILGTLTGGGHIWLVNPNGILIHEGATVNVGNLHLSTRTLSDGVLNSFVPDGKHSLTGTIGGDVINMGTLNATSISVEGNNITFKNTADVKNGDAINTNVKLTASDAKDDKGNYLYGIHIGSAVVGEAEDVNGTQYKGVTLSKPTGWTMNRTEDEAMYMLVNNAYELQNMQNNLSGNYMLAGNIDANSIEGFTPIGTGSGQNAFSGRFDGLNYTVSNLHLKAVNDVTVRAGLFGVNRGVVENLEVAGTTEVTNNTEYRIQVLGAVAGSNSGTLRNVSNTSDIDVSGLAKGVNQFGGVVGVNGGTIDRAYNTGTLTANSNLFELTLGGVAGRNSGTITNAFNTGDLSDEGKGSANSSYVGGLVGYMESGSIENAYNSGALKSDSQKDGTAYLGGIVGYLNDGTVQKTYNSGALSGEKDVGGVVGNKVGWDNDPDYPSPNPLADSYSTYHQDRPVQYGYYYDVRDGNELIDSNKMTQGTYAFDFSANGAWRIYKDNTMPLLTAFLTRADQSKGEVVYNGTTTTGDVGTNYVESAFSGVVNQIGGVNYVYDYTKVTPKALTLTAGSIDKTYDGTDTATLTANNLSGVVAGDTLTVSTTSATYADKNVGTGKTVTYAGLTLGGTKAGNYTISASGSTTGNITAKEITATFADVSKTYDGTKNVTAGAGLLTGVVSGDDVTVSGTAAFTDKNVGTNKQVDYTGVTLGGTDAGNYSIAATVTGKGSINKADITVSVENITKTYDGNTKTDNTTDATGGALKVTSGTLFEGDTMSGGTKTYADKNAGTGNKTVTVSDVTVSDGNNGGNYNVTYAANTTSTINRKEAYVNFGSTTKTYDGTTSATPGTATFMSVIDADKGKVGMTADVAYEDKNVGTGKKVKYTNIKLTGTEAQNYYLRDTSFDVLTGTITRKALYLVAAPVTITEGEATPTTWSGNLTGFVADEGLGANDVYFFALDDPAAASVGKYSITGTLNGAASGNYGQNYTFANAASNATAFTIAAKSMTPQEIVADNVDAQGAVKEYTNVVSSLESGANTVLPTTNVPTTDSVIQTNSVLPTSSVLPTGNAQPTESNLPTGNAQPTEAAQENNSASGEQNGVQEQNGLLPAQQTDNGQPPASKQESHLGITYTDINMPKSMSIEALAASLNGEPTQQGNAGATLNAAPTEPTAAISGEPLGTEPTANGTVEDNEEA